MDLSLYINPTTDRPWRKGGRDPRMPIQRVRIRCEHQRERLRKVGGLKIARV